MSKHSALFWIVGFAVICMSCFGCEDTENDKGDADAGDMGIDTEVDSGSGAEPEVTPDFCVPDESAPVPPRDSYGSWQKIELPGTVCGNNSQFKFFVRYSQTSNNLIVMFEGGGACWDYPSCSGDGGIRGAANTNGIQDGHMAWNGNLPLMRLDETNPVSDWNMVFIPYCTGDLNIGNSVITYENPDPSGEDLEFHHAGYPNMKKIVPWLNEHFSVVPKLLVTGCSAGGAGAFFNYHFLRQGIEGAQCGYLLNDSGPIFPSTGPSKQLHEKVIDSWGGDKIVEELAQEFPQYDTEEIRANIGRLNQILAELYPQDRLSITLFRLDFNYSLYSYDTFFNFPSQEEIHQMWWEDVQALMEIYDQSDNLAYYIPYYRSDMCSHCVTIPPIGHLISILTEPYLGSEVQAEDMDLRDFVVELLDESAPLNSYLEAEQPGEGLSPQEAESCRGITPL